MKIYLVRHGQSRWQVERDERDWDSPLTELGRQQAQRLGDWLAAEPRLDRDERIEIASIQVSPLVRAQETADYLTNALSLPATTNDHLREADFWVSEHLPSGESPYQALPRYEPPVIYATFKEQTQQALHSLAETAESAGGPVLAVSHGGLISTMLRIATGGDHVSFWIYNTTLNLLEWKRGRWHFVYLNLWDHLPPEMRTY